MTTSTKLSSSVNVKSFKKNLPTCTALEALLLPKLRYDRGGGGPTVPGFIQDKQASYTERIDLLFKLFFVKEIRRVIE